jgi:hypothetical protein
MPAPDLLESAGQAGAGSAIETGGEVVAGQRFGTALGQLPPQRGQSGRVVRCDDCEPLQQRGGRHCAVGVPAFRGSGIQMLHGCPFIRNPRREDADPAFSSNAPVCVLHRPGKFVRHMRFDNCKSTN